MTTWKYVTLKKDRTVKMLCRYYMLLNSSNQSDKVPQCSDQMTSLIGAVASGLWVYIPAWNCVVYFINVFWVISKVQFKTKSDHFLENHMFIYIALGSYLWLQFPIWCWARDRARATEQFSVHGASSRWFPAAHGTEWHMTMRQLGRRRSWCFHRAVSVRAQARSDESFCWW